LATGPVAVLLKRYRPKLPNVLIAVALTTLVSWQIGFERTLTVAPHAIQDAQERSLVEEYLAQEQRLEALQTQLAQQRVQLNDARQNLPETRVG
jgi:sulfate permease, SulP family